MNHRFMNYFYPILDKDVVCQNCNFKVSNCIKFAVRSALTLEARLYGCELQFQHHCSSLSLSIFTED